MRRLGLIPILLAVAVFAPTASASQLIDRNAQGVQLAVNAQGEAMVTYRAGGKVRHVLAWGALNAIAPTTARKQVALTLDYAGGWGKYHRDYWKTFLNACTPYDGPPLGWLVYGCKAPDGTYWALQSWQKMLPNYGVSPSKSAAAWELHLSHWSGDLPVLKVTLNWAYRKFDHIFGTYIYNGTPVAGFKATPGGNPLDTFGRNLYVDTFNSKYGKGWKRENSFLMHTGTGAFCYGFFSHGSHPVGAGEKYRATIIGPGVTPDAFWQGYAPGAYDRSIDSTANDEIRALGDSLCKPN